MSIPVITVTSHIEPTERLTTSLLKTGWSFHLIETKWRGFGTKIIETYKHLCEHPEITEFVFCDAFDVVALGSPKEFKEKLLDCNMLLSAEKGLWPPTMDIFRERYTQYPHGFNYPNSGLYYAKSDFFKMIFEANSPEYWSDDQEWFHGQILSGIKISLDNDQKVFNSHSFIQDGEYTYENGRLQINNNEPVFVHSNARTFDPKLEEIL